MTFEAGITRDIFCCVIGPLPGAGKCVKVAPTGQERERGSGEEGEDFRWTRGRRKQRGEKDRKGEKYYRKPDSFGEHSYVK